MIVVFSSITVDLMTPVAQLPVRDEVEPDAEAVNYIVRALVNLYAFDKSLPSQGPRFLDWVDKNPEYAAAYV